MKAIVFDEEALKLLKNSSDKYGGVKRVLEVVNTYANLAELKSEVEKLEENKMNVEAKLKKAKADYAHLQTVIGMCDTLLHKLRFSIPAITEIYEVAKKYGEPIEVMKAIRRYGELKAIEGEVEKLTAKKSELESRVKELSDQAQALRALMDELKNTARGLLKPFVAEISKSVNLLKEKFAEALNAISSEYEAYAKRLGELEAEAGKLEEELLLAKVVQSLIKYPSESEKLPLDYDILLLSAVMNHCIVKGVNPKVKAGDTITSKYNITKEVELLDLIEWAMRGLKSSLGSTSGGRA